MERMDRKFLATAKYKTIFEFPVRFADLDVQLHVNNAATVVLVQEGRMQFHRKLRFAELLDGRRSMVAGLHVEYAREMYQEPVEVRCGIGKIGNTSYTLNQLIMQKGQPCIFAETVVAFADANGSAPIPDALRAEMAKYLLVAA